MKENRKPEAIEAVPEPYPLSAPEKKKNRSHRETKQVRTRCRPRDFLSMLLPRAGRRAFGLTSRRMQTQAGVPDVTSRSPLPCPLSHFPLFPSLPLLLWSGVFAFFDWTCWELTA